MDSGVYPHGQYPRLVYGFYKTKDDNYVFVAPLQEEHWRAFVDVIGSDELRDPSKYGTLMQRAKHSEDGALIVAEWVAARTRPEVKSD